MKSCFKEGQDGVVILDYDDFNEKKCVPYQYNADLVEDVRPTLKFISMSLLIVALILDIMTCKCR